MSPTPKAGRDVIRIEGVDAATFLQGQLSQDVEALGPDVSASSLLLQPTGKMGFLVEVTRVDDTTFELAVDTGFGQAVVDRLTRFKLRTKATIELRPAPGRDGTTRVEGDGLPDAARLEQGTPAMGREIVDDVIPAELGAPVLEAAVSFTKGCYTGQELVARIDSRGGNVPRRLRGLVLAGASVPPEGAEIVVDGSPVGVVTSAAMSVTLGAPIALAFIRRSVIPPAAAVVHGDGYEAAAEIRELPLIGSD